MVVALWYLFFVEVVFDYFFFFEAEKDNYENKFLNEKILQQKSSYSGSYTLFETIFYYYCFFFFYSIAFEFKIPFEE